MVRGQTYSRLDTLLMCLEHESLAFTSPLQKSLYPLRYLPQRSSMLTSHNGESLARYELNVSFFSILGLLFL